MTGLFPLKWFSLRGFSVRGFWEVPGFAFSGGKELQNCHHRPDQPSLLSKDHHWEETSQGAIQELFSTQNQVPPKSPLARIPLAQPMMKGSLESLESLDSKKMVTFSLVATFWDSPQAQEYASCWRDPSSKKKVSKCRKMLQDSNHNYKHGAEKAHKKNTHTHTKLLKTHWTARCPWDTWPVSRKNCPFLSVFLK